jgi:hypothetical protein
MPLILGANSLTGGYAVDNSLRFEPSSSDYLNRTSGTSTDNKKLTFSFWVKRGDSGREQHYLNSSGTACQTYFASDDKIYFTDGTASGQYKTTQVFRDFSAWYHFVFAEDTTQATASDRIKIYVNGTQITAFDIATTPTLNAGSGWNANSTATFIGRYNPSPTGYYYSGYMSEFNFIDGQQLTPTDFGEFDADSGVWKPIAYTGTYGTNGFYLEFKDSSALGDDTSGEGNNFTVNNLTSIDQTTDTPTNNFATMNPLDNYYAGATFSEGNLQVATTNSGKAWNTSTIALSSGKWYFEAKNSATGGTTPSDKWNLIGISDRSATAVTDLGVANYQYAIYQYNGNVYASSGTSTTYAATWDTGDVIGCAIDLDNNKIYWSKEGAWGDGAGAWGSTTFNPATGAITIQAVASTLNGFYFVAMGDGGVNVSKTWQFNFGNAPYTITTGNADANGYGNFEYEVPAGYYALNTKNLAEFG